MRAGEGLTEATSVDGTSYTALPTAFKFEKTYSPTCTCKPPNQSWAQALEGAEKLLASGDRHDVTVTAALSDQMAKPLAAPATGAKGKAARDKRGASGVPVTADKRVVVEAQRGAQAPTASNESAGIGGAGPGREGSRPQRRPAHHRRRAGRRQEADPANRSVARSRPMSGSRAASSGPVSHPVSARRSG